MISTTLAVVALAGALGAGASPAPGWQTDYARAMTLASSEHKPIVVFISSGKPGNVADGMIPSDAAKLLRDSYVCVHADTSTTAGKNLAGQFALAEGLVISSPGGKHQALRHSGAVTGTDLTAKLNRYATAGQPTTTVNTAGTGVAGTPVPAAPPAPVTFGTPTLGCVGGNCPTAAPTINSFVVPSAPAYPFNSSCPNGKCPLQQPVIIR